MADDTKGTPDPVLDLAPLRETYEITGELTARGATRSFIGRRTADGQDVLITVLQVAGDVAAGKAAAQFAADAKLLERISHPHVPHVLEGRWIDAGRFALISQRVQGTTLAELMRGDRIPNARVADILGDVDGVLTWARDEQLSHRGVTPDGITIERDTNRVFISLSATAAPRTNRPDPRDDAQTIGQLALAMLSATPVEGATDGTLANMRPDLPMRVVDATMAMTAEADAGDEPNVTAYIASIAMADAIKEGELEVARLDAEFRAQVAAEREKWEGEQLACQTAFEAQANEFAGERADYERRSAKEREQLAQARAEVEAHREEVRDARAELDDARREYKAKRTQLEARTKEIERGVRGLEKMAHKLSQDALELERSLHITPTPADAADEGEEHGPRPLGEYVPGPWRPIEAGPPWTVPLETDEPVAAMSHGADDVPQPHHARPRWVAPAAVLGGALLLIGAGFGLSRLGHSPPVTVASVTPAMIARPDTAVPQTRTVVDSAAGVIGTTLKPDSADLARVRDSTAAAEERRARRARRAKAIADSLAVIRDSIARVKPDTGLRAKPDTGRTG